MDKTDFPIQVVEIRRKDYRPPGTISSSNKRFGDATPVVRKALARQISRVIKSFSPQFAKWPTVPAVAKVTLKEEALAKSHRPTALLTKTTCPIVGTLDYGELLVSATKDGLDRLSQRVLSTTGKKSVANITAIKHIEPYKVNDWNAQRLTKEAGRWAASGRMLKFHLFDHKNEEINEQVRAALFELAEELSVELVEKSYGKRVSFFSTQLPKQQPEARAALQSFVGLRSISPMPEYRPVDFGVMKHSADPIDETVLPPPDEGTTYPVVGVIDSGVCKKCTLLKPWIHATDQYVPNELQDNIHGTMVAGLIASAFHLNQKDERFPKTQAKVVDVQVFEKNIPLSEESLVSILEEVVPRYPEVNVWNLSLGGNDPTDVSQFSDFATFLDEMHDAYGCLFVVASGNHQHLQSWPQKKDMKGRDRVSSPGDCIRGLTVGSLANAHKEESLSKTDEPSPFSRRGPGPCHIPKPEVSHYGGNCTASSIYAQTGILSVGPENSLIESLGTSFATPLVASQAAAIWDYLEDSDGSCSAERTKALLVHSALIGQLRISKELLNFTGFGRPSDVVDALYCDPHAVTFLFDVDLQYGGVEFERWPIPMAEDLLTADGKFKGEIAMTLVYSPIVDKDFSSEYCRTNVDVGMGKYEEYEDEDGEITYGFKSIVPLAPKDVRDLFEKSQIEHGFKWSPVKAYHAVFPRGKNVSTWRLKMKASKRAELLSSEEPQPAILLVTLRALDDEADVYNETIRLVNQEGWVTTPIDEHVQIKIAR